MIFEIIGRASFWLLICVSDHSLNTYFMLENKLSVNRRPMLILEKEIISKADVSTIENIRASKNEGALVIPSSIPTTPTTLTGFIR